MENEIVHMPEQIQELTLLLMYLTSWQERRTIGLRRKPHKTDEICGKAHAHESQHCAVAERRAHKTR